ncbi:hypothetical protein SDC9_159221 [bioreactor metagenome]|uniref:Uncharacterized protein n=1 Tax=bioreactor metagenome TaxID=1076179 RepID=A0A645FEK8_9ZZZZ
MQFFGELLIVCAETRDAIEHVQRHTKGSKRAAVFRFVAAQRGVCALESFHHGLCVLQQPALFFQLFFFPNGQIRRVDFFDLIGKQVDSSRALLLVELRSRKQPLCFAHLVICLCDAGFYLQRVSACKTV